MEVEGTIWSLALLTGSWEIWTFVALTLASVAVIVDGGRRLWHGNDRTEPLRPSWHP